MAFIPVYILILFFLIAIDYVAGIRIEKASGKARKGYLLISILATVLVLFVFKYFNFFNANMVGLASFLNWNYPLGALGLILPIGLSFHTFQSLSYVIEVYRGRYRAERNLGIYALYVMFYPQLVAGPIERPQNLIHQFYEHHCFNASEFASGLKLMLWGVFKKVVVADRLALFVLPVFANPHDYTGPSFVVAAVFFAFQIYCDFSGYSDIAIGAAQTMGFKLMKNFNRPYFAKSIAEFWKRWHISLSTWFKDYLYIPLGGNRVSVPRRYFNLLAVFLVSGLWHGANWTFVLWGGLHGLYIIIGSLTERLRQRITGSLRITALPRLHKVICIAITFSLVCFSWIFFRADTVSDAWHMATHLFSGWGTFIASAFSAAISFEFGKGAFAPILLGQAPLSFAIAVAGIVFMEIVHLHERSTGNFREVLDHNPLAGRWAFYYTLIFAILLFGVFDNAQQFIYFQF